MCEPRNLWDDLTKSSVPGALPLAGCVAQTLTVTTPEETVSDPPFPQLITDDLSNRFVSDPIPGHYAFSLRVLFFETEFHCIEKADFKIAMTLLPQPPS